MWYNEICESLLATLAKRKRTVKMKITKVNAENFDTEVMKSEKTVLIDFYADWCGPCKMLSPIVDEIAEERDDIKVCKVNVDENEELAVKFGVMSIPMLVVMENGTVKNTSLGYVTKDKIISLL